jgi:hypothetical protein
MEQLESYLPPAGLILATDVLDRIDMIVAPASPSNPRTTATAPMS